MKDYTEVFEKHRLRKIEETKHVRMYRMSDPETSNMFVTLTEIKDGLIITGDVPFDRHGNGSVVKCGPLTEETGNSSAICAPYITRAFEWFGGELNAGYMASKFLRPSWDACEARREIEARIAELEDPEQHEQNDELKSHVESLKEILESDFDAEWEFWASLNKCQLEAVQWLIYLFERFPGQCYDRDDLGKLVAIQKRFAQLWEVKCLLDLDQNPDIRWSGSPKDYSEESPYMRQRESLKSCVEAIAEDWQWRQERGQVTGVPGLMAYKRVPKPTCDQIYAAIKSASDETVKALIKEGKFENAARTILTTLGEDTSTDGSAFGDAFISAWCGGEPDGSALLDNIEEVVSVLETSLRGATQEGFDLSVKFADSKRLKGFFQNTCRYIEGYYQGKMFADLKESCIGLDLLIELGIDVGERLKPVESTITSL